jgi:hypothetical protein
MSNLTGRPVTPKGTPKAKRRKPSSHWAAAYGTDAEYQAFCRKLPSASSGATPCIYAHYRSATNSGIGIKPEFSGLPLTYSEHLLQHQIGQYEFASREWWETQIKAHLSLWIRSKTRGDK